MQYREPRLPCDTPISVVTGSAVCRGELLNLNATGACMRGVLDLQRSMVIELRFLHLQFEAKVMWVRGSRVGLSFPLPLSPPEIATLRRELGTGMGSSRHWGAKDTFVLREME